MDGNARFCRGLVERGDETRPAAPGLDREPAPEAEAAVFLLESLAAVTRLEAHALARVTRAGWGGCGSRAARPDRGRRGTGSAAPCRRSNLLRCRRRNRSPPAHARRDRASARGAHRCRRRPPAWRRRYRCYCRPALPRARLRAGARERRPRPRRALPRARRCRRPRPRHRPSASRSSYSCRPGLRRRRRTFCRRRVRHAGGCNSSDRDLGVKALATVIPDGGGRHRLCRCCIVSTCLGPSIRRRRSRVRYAMPKVPVGR